MILRSLPLPTEPWFDPKTGNPTPEYFAYARDADFVMRHSVRFVERYFTFANDAQILDIGNVPAGAILLKPISGVHVIQAFNAGTANVAEIGPSTSTELWGTDLPLGAIGFFPIDEAVSNVVAVGQSLVQVTVDLTGTATAGIARAIVCYLIPSRAP